MAESAGSGSGEREIPLPGGGVMRDAPAPEEDVALPVAFVSLLQPFSLMALTGLGLIPHPEAERPSVRPALARSAIGLLELLLDRTEGRRTPEETQLLNELLGALKLQYLEVCGRRDDA